MLSLTANVKCCAAGTSGRRLPTAFGWLLPGAVLILIPKCPLCIVSYAAMFSGVGLSISAAADLRTGLITVCCPSLGYLVLRFAVRLWRYLPA
jgi:hypothetical protein